MQPTLHSTEYRRKVRTMSEKKIAAETPAAEPKTRKSAKAPARRGRPPLAPELYVEMSGKVYVKPEEDAAYYVINKVSGKLDL